MKLKALLLLVFFLASDVHAQIAQWLIPASYNELKINDELGLVITDSINKTVIWNLDGKRLAETSDQLNSFADNFAVTTKPGTDIVTGFVNKDGGFTAFNGFKVAYNHPYFSNGYLLVKEDDYYRFVNTRGDLTDGRLIKAFPYSNGYAACYSYKDIVKLKDPYFFLINEDRSNVLFFFNGKPFSYDDVDFISSVNDEGIAVVVAKQRVYLFNGKDRTLSPVFANTGETNLKNQAKISGGISLQAFMDTSGGKHLEATCGKEDKVRFTFDEFLVPESIAINGKETKYKQKEIAKHDYRSPLKITVDGNKQGLSFSTEDMDVLPPQFDKVEMCIEDKAIVVLEGKYGMLKVIKDKNFKLTMNKGNDIPFRHRKFETVLRVDLPVEISSVNTRIEIDAETGCEIDKTSKEAKDTDEGNYIEYNCVLNIPRYLSANTTEIPYPARVMYNGLVSPEIPFKVNAWHYKYFTVDQIDSETSVTDAVLSFSFNINAQRTMDDDVYPWEVHVSVDTLQTEIERLSETRYKCKVFPLNEGVNNIEILVVEQGCPPVSFPFEVTYTKPVGRARTKENVVIQKKPEPSIEL